LYPSAYLSELDFGLVERLALELLLFEEHRELFERQLAVTIAVHEHDALQQLFLGLDDHRCRDVLEHDDPI